MSKKILFLVLLIFITLTAWKQDSNAKTWPPGSKIPADSIIAAIERGESIIIDSCEIFGALVRNGTWGRPDTIKSFIDIKHSTFWDSVSFDFCYFMKDVTFFRDTFRNVEFYQVTFGGYADFRGTAFGGNADFREATFRGSANFLQAMFRGDADFLGTRFGGEAYFRFTTFGGYADFRATRFGGEAYFDVATFGGEAHFWLTKFDSTADFSWATFDETANFRMATFSGDADFREAAFGGNANFEGTKFGEKVDLSLVEFENITISWKQLKDRLICDPPVSYKLMKHFEENRQLDDADGVYLFLKKNETFEMKWYELTKYWGYLMWVTCGYGVQPFYTIFWSIGIILVLMLFYTKPNAIREIEKEFGHRRRRRKSRTVHKGLREKLYDAFCFSLQTFIIGVVPDWYPTEEFLIKFWKIKRIKFRTLSMIEGALGWILLVLFVVTLTRKFIR